MNKSYLFFLILFLLPFIQINAQRKFQFNAQSKFGIPVFENEKSYLKNGGINLTQGLGFRILLNEKESLCTGILLDLEFGEEYQSRSLAFPLRYKYNIKKIGLSAGLVIVWHKYLKVGNTEWGDDFTYLAYNSTGQAHWTNTHVASGTTELDKKVNRQFIFGCHYQISNHLSLDLEVRIYGSRNDFRAGPYGRGGSPFANTASLGISYSFEPSKIFKP